MTTQATIVVTFGENVSSSNHFVRAELDDTLNLNSEGKSKTSFNPGDDVYFLIQHDSTVRIRAIRSTSGQVQSLGAVSRSREQIMLYTELNEIQDFGYTGGTANIWRYGNALGLESEGITSFKATLGTFPAIAKVSGGL